MLHGNRCVDLSGLCRLKIRQRFHHLGVRRFLGTTMSCGFWLVPLASMYASP
jgi:hypothetical protein